jgi:hypothetical protein
MSPDEAKELIITAWLFGQLLGAIGYHLVLQAIRLLVKRRNNMTDKDKKRLLMVIKGAPSPFGKTDSQLAQEYRNWYFGARLSLTAAEQFAPGATTQPPKA